MLNEAIKEIQDWQTENDWSKVKEIKNIVPKQCNGLKDSYKEMFIRSLTEDKEKWARKTCTADVSWYNYTSPLYGKIQFEVDYNFCAAFVNFDGKQMLRFSIHIPFSAFRKAVKKMERYIQDCKLYEKNKLLSSIYDEMRGSI